MQTILVGLSGGVDSTVTATLLKKQGYNVIGATMSIWGDKSHPGVAKKNPHRDACFGPNEKEDIEAAGRLAQELDIPYYIFDCAEEYEEIVLKYFKSEYLKGKTPNPCIWCNALIKFGVLPHLARKKGINFDKFATGHYARVGFENNRYFIKQGIDPTKDQSYFLYRLKQEQLKEIMLPLGEYTKAQIRDIARKEGLKVAEKPDSQDFYDGDYNELLNVEEKIGYIKDTEGKILGEHKGIWNYTIGQRKGLKIAAAEPLYVLSLDKDKNEVIVGYKDKTFKNELSAVDINFVSCDKIPQSSNLYAKIRSSQKPQKVTARMENDKLIVNFEEYQKSIAPGQSVVVYDDDKIILGGTIESAK